MLSISPHLKNFDNWKVSMSHNIALGKVNPSQKADHNHGEGALSAMLTPVSGSEYEITRR